MDTISVFAIISGIIGIGFFSEYVFKKYKIADVIILIITGIIIGSVLKWASKDSFGSATQLFSTFALVFILFQGALNIDFKVLFKSLSKTFNLTIVSFIFTIIIVSIISYLFGYSIIQAILIGIILAGTSSAVVIPLVNNIDMREKYGTLLTLESALSDVLCIIGTITVIEIIKSGKIVASEIFKSILSSFSLALVVGLIVGLIWVKVLNKYDNLPNSYILTIGVLMGLYAFVQSPFVQASGAIAALSFGLILGNSKSILNLFNKNKKNSSNNENLYKNKNVLDLGAKNFYSQISFFVKVFFFVYLGIMMDFSNPTIFLYGLMITLGIYLIRPFAIKLVFRKNKIDIKEKIFLEILIPKGLAAAVLAGVAVNSNIFGKNSGDFISLILSVILLSILFTSILVFLAEKKKFKGLLPFLNRN